jgi:hypothetical protein
MGTLSPQIDGSPKGVKPSNSEMRTQVRGLISTLLYGQDDSVERRRQVRYAFPHPVYLTPVGDDGSTPDGESIAAAGKDLSEGGLGFFHPAPLPTKRMIVSLQLGDGSWMAFVIELTRSRAIRQGWYETGGRFVEAVPSPMESA